MPKEQITPGDLATIMETAARYGLQLTGRREPYADGYRKYGFWHPEIRLWIFTIDSDWRLRRRIRFEKRFIGALRHNGVLACLEKGGGKNCSVEENDLEHALRVCTCPFCTPDSSRVVAECEHTLELRDGYPVAQGHTLVIPRQHVASIFDLAASGQAAVWNLVAQVRADLTARLRPDGFTIGANDGTAAGQTVPHAHIHVIPRWTGDVPDPRGGVRWVIPGKADYWSQP